MKYLEKKEDKIKFLELSLKYILMNKVKYRNWKLIHDIFINLISTEKIELKKIKLYATILINSSIECHYLDDEYLLKIEVNQLKKILSMKDNKSNNYDDLEERINELYNIEKNKSLKKENN